MATEPQHNEVTENGQESSASLDSPSAQTESVGRSFVDAVWEKFNDDTHMDDCDVLYVPKKGPAKITDSGHLILPRTLHMTDCGITEAGQAFDMSRMCQYVTELDLTQNNLSSWNEVFSVICCMPRLVFLNLTNNPLQTPTNLFIEGINDCTFDSREKSIPSTSTDFVNDDNHSSPNTDTFSRSIVSESALADNTDDDDNANIRSTAEREIQLINITCEENWATTSTDKATNSYSDPADVGIFKFSKSDLPHLKQLVLNDTRIEWQWIVQLLSVFSELEELHLSLNQYTSVDLPPDLSYPSLTRLFFNSNKVWTWSEINKLGRAFPNLQQLYMAENELNSLDDIDSITESFSCLTLLSVNKTKLHGWDVIERLRLFPSLTDVRLQGIPFLEAIEEKERRRLLVARLPNIIRLNGSRITELEREDAERSFIRVFMDHTDKPARYYELEKIYGRLDPLAKVILKPQNVFKVFVVMENKREPLEVDVNQSVRDLKKTLQNFAGLSANKFCLYYLDKQLDVGADKLRFPDRMLYTYNLSDGDEFIIEPK